MPRTEVASVANHDFGAPVAVGTVLEFQVKKGCLVSLRFEAPYGTSNATVSVEVSANGTAYTATTVALNNIAVTNEVIVKDGVKDFGNLLLREGVDNFMRIRASGGTRLQMQMRGGESLIEIKNI